MLLMISMVSAVAQNQAYHMDKWQVRLELSTAQAPLIRFLLWHTWRVWRCVLSCGTSSALCPKMNMLSSPISSAISTLAPSMVPMMRLPFIMNFMLPVPEASVPAVEICWDSSVPASANTRKHRLPLLPTSHYISSHLTWIKQPTICKAEEKNSVGHRQGHEDILHRV